VKSCRQPIRYFGAFLLICAGAFGILFSPSVGLHGGKETRSFTMNQVQEYSWGAAVASSKLELPFVRNQRGLIFMNVFLAGSLGALFSGVHWYAALRSRPLLRD
jgi:hypothetical protein